jgi:FtsH-binding integral membrane protein
MNDQQGEQGRQSLDQQFSWWVNLFVSLGQIMCKMVEVLTRWPGSMGERYLGIQAAISWMVCFFWAGFFPGKDPRPMMLLWFAATSALVIHRIAGAWRRNRGYVVHSVYIGTPIFWSYSVEFVLVLMVGLVTVNINTPLGSYLIVAAIGLWISGTYQRAAEKSRLRAIRDARLENEWLMQQQDQL